VKIGVLSGGSSLEREISLKTGSAVVSALKKLGHKVVPLIFEDDLQPFIPQLKNVDLVFNALHGGAGEDGTIQGLLTSLGIPFTGSGSLASGLCMNKHLSKTIVRYNQLPTPDWLLTTSVSVSNIAFDFGYPVVVKPSDQGSTIGVSIVNRPEDLSAALEGAQKFSREVLIEKYIAGRELTVAIVGEEVFPIVEIEPSHECYDYACKYEAGMSKYSCPADLDPDTTKEMQEIALEIYQILGCEQYGRVDFRLDENQHPWFLELNTLPGMTDTSLVPKAARARGLSFEQLIERIIQEALRKT
jgi:D-alanine-D-alanine ligase